MQLIAGSDTQWFCSKTGTTVSRVTWRLERLERSSDLAHRYKFCDVKKDVAILRRTCEQAESPLMHGAAPACEGAVASRTCELGLDTVTVSGGNPQQLGLVPGRDSQQGSKLIPPGQEMACLQESMLESSGKRLHFPWSFL